MPYQLPDPITPFGLYLAVTWRPGESSLSHPYLLTSGVRSVSRPCLDSSPVVALPLLYSITSGTSEELRIIEAFCCIWLKLFNENCTVTPGCCFLKSVMAWSQAIW